MPDFRMQPNSFPISSVIDAASRNATLQEQARQAGNASLIEGLKSIGQVGQSLVDQKLQIAQALAQAKLFAQTPQGQQMMGTNQVATTPQGPVTPNQTAAYNPQTGSVTPNQSPVDVGSIATAMRGMSPKDFFDNMTQAQAARTQQGELALKQQTEPQKIAIEGKRATTDELLRSMMLGIQGSQANTQAVHTENEHEDALRTRRDALLKNISLLPDALNPSSAASKQEIANIDAVLAKKGSGPLPGKKFQTGSGITYKVNP